MSFSLEKTVSKIRQAGKIFNKGKVCQKGVIGRKDSGDRTKGK